MIKKREYVSFYLLEVFILFFFIIIKEDVILGWGYDKVCMSVLDIGLIVICIEILVLN